LWRKRDAWLGSRRMKNLLALVFLVIVILGVAGCGSVESYGGGPGSQSAASGDQ
jgi:hypothetical protein